MSRKDNLMLLVFKPKIVDSSNVHRTDALLLKCKNHVLQMQNDILYIYFYWNKNAVLWP